MLNVTREIIVINVDLPGCPAILEIDPICIVAREWTENGTTYRFTEDQTDAFVNLMSGLDEMMCEIGDGDAPQPVVVWADTRDEVRMTCVECGDLGFNDDMAAGENGITCGSCLD